jgi:hypothetical protein
MLPKTSVGLSAIFGTLYLTLGVPHLVVNTSLLIKDLYKDGVKPGDFKSYFIRRQNKDQAAYLQALADAEARPDTQGTEAPKFTEADNIEIEKIISEIEKNNQSWLGGAVESIKSWKIFSKLSKSSGSEINSLRGAMTHFCFSYASFTHSAYYYTKFWNGFFGFRSFIWTPTLWMTFLVFPNYYGTIMKEAPGVVRPTQLNGGMRTLPNEAQLRFARLFSSSRESIDQLRLFEEKIIPVEQEIMAASLKVTFQKLIEFSQTLPEISKIIEMQSKVKTITSAELDNLTQQQRLFFRKHFDLLYEESMKKFLGGLIQSNSQINPSTDGNAGLPETLSEFKEASLKLVDSLKISPDQATRIVNESATAAVVDQATEFTETTRLNADRLQTNYEHAMLSKMDPANNRQVNRIRTTNRQVVKPKAMARAVRSMIASNIVDKPMELSLIFLCMAGIKEGILAPIQPEMFSENAWFHLSRFVFSNGFIYGVISGVLADVWMKLQMDEFNDSSFGEVPTGEDAKGSYAKWFAKKTFKNPENLWWKNQVNYFKLIWANMRAAFTTMIIVNLVTLGRFDLDSYIVGYLLVYLTPFSGFAMKLEQGFEFAASYDLKDIPERFRSHPKTQAFMAKVTGQRRITFNFFYKLYENILGNFLGNFQNMTTPELGSRAFSRAIFFGYTPTEIAVSGFRKITGLGFLPEVTKAPFRYCEFLLSNRYTDFVKVPKL